jgi:hypothetical protein
VLYIFLQDFASVYSFINIECLPSKVLLTSAVLLQATTEIEIAIINNTFSFWFICNLSVLAKNIKK